MRLLLNLLKSAIAPIAAVCLLSACSFTENNPAVTDMATVLSGTTAIAVSTMPTTAPPETTSVPTITTEPISHTTYPTELSDPVALTSSPASSDAQITEPTASISQTMPTAASEAVVSTFAAAVSVPQSTASTSATTTAAPQTTAWSPATTMLTTTTPPATTPQTTAMDIEEIGFGVTPIVVETPHTGGEVYGNERATIDATDKAEGYVLIRYLGGGDARIKVLITGPGGVQYTYNLNSDGSYEVFPFSDGDGNYVIGVYQNTTGNKYSTVYKTTVSVTMKNAFAVFLHPNQYVNYSTDSQAIKLAAQLTANAAGTLEKVEAVYRYVTETISYDYALAASVQSGYLPDIDAVLAKRSGICFDYAAVMTSMLRGLGIPTKLVVGYCGTEYHAWINVYVEGQGWVNSVVFFDGSTWNHMDPTYASSRPEIGDFSARYTYTAKYIY